MNNISTATEVASPLAIVTINNGEAVTTSLVLAQLLEREHDSVILLVRKHKQSLDKFGEVIYDRSEIGRVGAIKPLTFAILNEQQATLLISFMSNSQKVVDFKIKLVKAFYEMRMKLEAEKIKKLENEASLTKAIRAGLENAIKERADKDCNSELHDKLNNMQKAFDALYRMYKLSEDDLEQTFTQMNEIYELSKKWEDNRISITDFPRLINLARELHDVKGAVWSCHREAALLICGLVDKKTKDKINKVAADRIKAKELNNLPLYF